jgi:hypothetical protein
MSKRVSEWDKLKQKGSLSYKTGVEPIDLFKAGEMIWDWCLGEIIAKAYRSREDFSWSIDEIGNVYKVSQPGEVLKDLEEIIHHAEMLKAVINETREKPTNKV